MADRNRDQWGNPYGQDWDQNENRYNRYQDDQQRNRKYGNVNNDRDYDQVRRAFSNYPPGYTDDYQGDYGSGSYRSNYGDQYRAENDYNGRYMGSSNQVGSSNYNRGRDQYQDYGNRYGTSGGYGNREGDRDRRNYNQGRRNRESDWNRNQRTSFGEQGYYGGDYDRNRDRNYDRGNIREDRSWWDKTTDEVSSWFGDNDAERRRDRDKQMSGHHKGKGPKGYSRSDERIREDISDRLSDDDYVDASNIDVQVNSGEVVLSGNVDSRGAKYRAEDIAEHISGVRNVENRLHIDLERHTI